MSEITVSDLIEGLRGFPGHHTVYFGGLDFYRLKNLGGDYVHVEFNQVVYKDEKGCVHVDNLDKE